MFPTLPPLCLPHRHRPSPLAATKLQIRKTPTPESDLGALSGWNSFSSTPNSPPALFVCVPESIRTSRQHHSKVWPTEIRRGRCQSRRMEQMDVDYSTVRLGRSR